MEVLNFVKFIGIKWEDQRYYIFYLGIFYLILKETAVVGYFNHENARRAAK